MATSVDIGLARVLTATSGELVQAGAEVFDQVVIDGRAAKAGALFFCIKGERFDGHDFVPQAVASGAAGVVVQRGRTVEAGSATVIAVDDTVRALGALARAHRQSMSGLRVAGVAGSNGKTTTKEMIASILVAAVGADAVLKTEGNLNNHLGVPLTLLRLTRAHRFAVVEMGMSALGELAYLTELAQPDVAVVVSIAIEHLEHLHTLKNVAQAEGEILRGLSAHGVGVVPAADPLIAPHAAHLEGRRVTFGTREQGAQIAIENVAPYASGVRFTLHLPGLTSHIGAQARVPLVGAHNAMNAAAAAAVARALGINEGSILEGLATVTPAKHRAQLVTVGDRMVLDDCYNASPVSMRSALDALVAATPKGRKRVAVLGDMLELGPDEGSMHGDIGIYASSRVDELIAFGPRSRELAAEAQQTLGAHVLHSDDVGAVVARVLEVSGPGDVILVKASRGMRLERVIDGLQARLGNG